MQLETIIDSKLDTVTSYAHLAEIITEIEVTGQNPL